MIYDLSPLVSPRLSVWPGDTPARREVLTDSIDLFHSKPLPSHHAAFGHGMAALEGLVMAHVPSGTYELVALPLRLDGFDASPVRAVLRTLP